MSSERDKDVKASDDKTEDVIPAKIGPKVHSANSWESADLGDDDRKKKFLKLMGASKKEHHGRFVIGNQEPANIHTRKKSETEAVNKELEDQYKHSYEHKITRWHHKGLGFSGEDSKPAEGDRSNTSEAEGADKKDDQSGEGREGNRVTPVGLNVHSANSWESADLGDDDRKKKFLKLMGASKKEHHGRFVIGNQEPANIHTRQKSETEAVNKELEDQYTHSYEHKITRWHHKGLGFSGEDNKPAEAEGTDKRGDQSGEGSEGKGDNSVAARDSQTERVERKRESTETSETNSSAHKKPKMMMAFVKSSDS